MVEQLQRFLNFYKSWLGLWMACFKISFTGAAVAGWKSVRHRVYPPRFIIKSTLNDDDCSKLVGLTDELLRTTAYSLLRTTAKGAIHISEAEWKVLLGSCQKHVLASTE